MGKSVIIMCGMSLNGLNEGRNEELMSTHNIYFREELLFEKKKKKKKKLPYLELKFFLAYHHGMFLLVKAWHSG